jgi:hypothetical protein
MTVEQLSAAYKAEPFRPFIMHLADGQQIPVHSREFILPPPVGRTTVVFQPDGTMNIIDLLLVTNLEFKPVKNGASRRRR